MFGFVSGSISSYLVYMVGRVQFSDRFHFSSVPGSHNYTRTANSEVFLHFIELEDSTTMHC